MPEETIETQPTEKKESAAANEEVAEVETTKVEAAADAVTENVDTPVVEVDEPKEETEAASEIAAEEVSQEVMPEPPKTDVPAETDITGDAPVAPGEEDAKEVAVEVEPKAEEKEEELAQEETPEPLPADVPVETIVTGEAPEAPAVEEEEEVNVKQVGEEATATWNEWGVNQYIACGLHGHAPEIWIACWIMRRPNNKIGHLSATPKTKKLLLLNSKLCKRLKGN